MGVPKDKRGKGLSINFKCIILCTKTVYTISVGSTGYSGSLKEKQRFLKGKIKSKFITYNWHDSELSFLEAIFARGDRRIGKVLVKAWEKGCKFDGWGEHFKFRKWMEAFEECEIDP